jgi:hypothetical protein
MNPSIRGIDHFPRRKWQMNPSIRGIDHFPGRKWQIDLSIREIYQFSGREQTKAGWCLPAAVKMHKLYSRPVT